MRFCLIIPLVAVVAAAPQLYSHHSFAATYVEDQLQTVEGDLVQFLYRNPHSFLQVEVKDSTGKTTRYTVEWGGLGALDRQGVKRDTLRPGDHIVIVGNPGRNPGDYRIRLIRMQRPSDGWSWGVRPGETFQ